MDDEQLRIMADNLAPHLKRFELLRAEHLQKCLEAFSRGDFVRISEEGVEAISPHDLYIDREQSPSL